MLPLAREVGRSRGSRERLLWLETQMQGVAGVPGCWGLSERALQHPLPGEEDPVAHLLCLLCPL